MIEQLENKLDSFDADERGEALARLVEMVETGEIELPEAGTHINLHCHTFFSYNCYGYSPTKFAWLARKSGLAVAGVVDFDVLDAADEFLDACRILNLKGCAGLETRVFVPEFADKVINSPGEPGISYHMGIGFPDTKLEPARQKFLHNLKLLAQRRNRELMNRVNKYLSPVELDYERDVLVLTPSGNATERHICFAYARKARNLFANDLQLANFWAEKLDIQPDSLELPEGVSLLNTIRKKTMKQGGIGYVRPDKGSFSLMADTNRFVLAAGGIPVVTWLDGTSDGEQQEEKLLQIGMSTGAAALNIIPDRNYTPGVDDQKLKNLYEIVELAEKLDLPLVVGTEMNSPGQKFIDSFTTDELSPLLPVFLKGAYIIYAHSALQGKCGLGYTSEWAKEKFQSTKDKNDFFEKLGEKLEPAEQDKLTGLDENSTPENILERIST